MINKILIDNAWMNVLQKESTLVYGNGLLKPAIDKEVPNKQKKWLLPGISALPGNAAYIHDRLVL